MSIKNYLLGLSPYDLEAEWHKLKNKIHGPENDGRTTAGGSAELDMWLEDLEAINQEMTTRGMTIPDQKSLEEQILDHLHFRWGPRTPVGMSLKLCSEAGEIADEAVKILEKRGNPADFLKETMDAVVVLSQLAAHQGYTLPQLQRMGLDHIRARRWPHDKEDDNGQI